MALPGDTIPKKCDLSPAVVAAAAPVSALSAAALPAAPGLGSLAPPAG